MEPTPQAAEIQPSSEDSQDTNRIQRLSSRDPVAVFAIEAFRTSFKAYQNAAEAFTASTGADVEEYIHDARVAIRRMRTCVALFDSILGTRPSRRIAKALKAAFKKLENVRDLDIVLKRLRAYKARLSEKRAEDFSNYMEACIRSRASALKSAREALDPAGVSGVRDAVREAMDVLHHKAPIGRPAEQDLPVILTREYRRLLDRGAPIGSESVSVSQYHAARRACKRFRYAQEFLQGAMGPRAELLISDLKALQDALGILNDVFLCQRSVASFVERSEGGGQTTRNPGSNPELTKYLASLQAEARKRAGGIPRRWVRIASRGFRSRLFASFIVPD